VAVGSFLAGHLVLPEADEKTLAGLKFSDALPSTWLSRRWPGA